MSDSPHRLPRLFLLFAFAAASCAVARGPSLDKIASEINATRYDQILLAVGDGIELSFAQHEDWNQQVQVQPDGRVPFRGLPEPMLVAGFTAEQIDERLEEAYSRVFESPELSVVVRERAARTVTVMGQVGNPGEVEIGPDNHLTLVQAIGKAGSFEVRSAYLAATLLVRWDPILQKQIAWRIDARVDHWEGAEPILLQPFDVVYIPNTPIYGAGIWVDNWIRRMIPLPFFQIN